MLKVREIIESLLEEASVLQDTQFQIKEGIDWYRLHKLGETTSFTVMSTRHLSDQERTSLALELMSFRIISPFQKLKLFSNLMELIVKFLGTSCTVLLRTFPLDSDSNLLKWP